MSLFRDSLCPPPLASDEAVRRYLDAIRALLDPDPLFRRRLRGVVVNHFVAGREGVAQPERRASEMGRIGRACLYASVALALSVGGVMGASRGALPGEFLYSVKLQMEGLRVALMPAHLHDDLAVARLSERINELGPLTAAGDGLHAASLANAISEGYDELAALGVTDVAAEGMLAQRLEVEAINRQVGSPMPAATMDRAGAMRLSREPSRSRPLDRPPPRGRPHLPGLALNWRPRAKRWTPRIRPATESVFRAQKTG